jgi:hypothetical protein
VIVRPEGVKDSALPPKGSKEYEQEQARLDKVASRPLPDYGLTGIPEQIEIPDQVQRLNALLVSIFGLDPQNLKLPNFRFVSGRTQTEWYYGRQVMTYPHPTDVPETAWEYFIRLPDGGRMECPADPADYPETWPEEWKSLPIGVEVVRKQKGDPHGGSKAGVRRRSSALTGGRTFTVRPRGRARTRRSGVVRTLTAVLDFRTNPTSRNSPSLSRSSSRARH